VRAPRGLEVSPETASAQRPCGLVHDVPGPRIPCAELACGEPMRALIGEAGRTRVSPAMAFSYGGGLSGSVPGRVAPTDLRQLPGAATRNPHTPLSRRPLGGCRVRGSAAAKRWLGNNAVRWRLRGIPVGTARHPSTHWVPGTPDHGARWPVPSRRAAAWEGRVAPAAWFRLPAGGRWGERADRALRPADSR